MKMRSFNAKQLCNIFKENGWRAEKNKGNSHLIHVKQGYSKIPIPVTHQGDLAKPLVKKILKQADLLHVING